jgi:hypothetical protein
MPIGLCKFSHFKLPGFITALRIPGKKIRKYTGMKIFFMASDDID